MERADLEYLLGIVANLSGMPVRLYQNSEQVYYRSVAFIPKDPILLHKDSVFQISDHIGYFYTEDFYYYGIVNAGEMKIVVGPSGQLPDDTQTLRNIAFRLDVPGDEKDDFILGMKSIVKMPIESTLQMLCTVNYILNGEKETLEDIAITGVKSEERQREKIGIFDNIPENTLRTRAEAVKSDVEAGNGQALHNTYSVEQSLMNLIRKGETELLSKWISEAPAVRGGILAPDLLRQQKNTFIVTATLASRAAIRGGLDVEEAFTLSDAYIRRCELTAYPNEIIKLQYQMILDYTERVNRLRCGENSSQLVLDVKNFIRHHLSETVTIEDIAKAMHMSRSHLSRRFKAEAGETLADCVMNEKIEEAKRLLRYTDKTLSAIGMYLGFSSPSHFSRTFHERTNMTPGEYRQKHA